MYSETNTFSDFLKNPVGIMLIIKNPVMKIDLKVNTQLVYMLIIRS